MEGMNHTPGPWTLERLATTFSGTVYKIGPFDAFVHYDPSRANGISEDELKANATLMSAAPDLLQAAEKGLDIAGLSDCPHGYIYSMGSQCDCTDHQEYRAMYVAVQKAKGIGA